MRSPLKLSHLQAEQMSFLQPLLIEQVLQPPEQTGGHPLSLLQSDVFPVLGGGAETRCTILAVLNRGLE